MPALPSWDKGDPDDSSADEDDHKVSKKIDRRMEPSPSEEKSSQPASSFNESKSSSSSSGAGAVPRRRRAGDGDDGAPSSSSAPQSTVSGWGGGGDGAFEKRQAPSASVADSKASDDDDSRGGGGGGSSSASRGSNKGGSRKGRSKHFDETPVDDIAEIPDLEDDHEEDITVQVAAAPKNVSRKVPALVDLDAELKTVVSSSVLPTGGGSQTSTLDLSLLTAGLVPASAVAEIDEPWDFDKLLQSVTQDFHAERDANSGGKDEDEADDGAARTTMPDRNGGSGGSGGVAASSSNGSSGVDASGNKLLADEDARRLDELVGAGKKTGAREVVGGRRARAQA